MESLQAYLAGSGRRPAWSPTPGVWVVGAGKGGVGTSTLAALLALSGSRQGREVLLVDGDEGVGSLHLLFGLDNPGPGLDALRGGEIMPEELLVRVERALWLLPAGRREGHSTLAWALGERRALLGRVAELYEAFQLVVVDGGSHLGSVVAALAAGAERLIAVTSADRIAVAATYALLKVAAQRFPGIPLEILFNRCGDSSSHTLFRTVETAARRFLGLNPRLAGSVPEDPELAASLALGRSLGQLPPHLRALAAAEAVRHRLAADGAAVRQGSTPPTPSPRLP